MSFLRPTCQSGNILEDEEQFMDVGQLGHVELQQGAVFFSTPPEEYHVGSRKGMRA